MTTRFTLLLALTALLGFGCGGSDAGAEDDVADTAGDETMMEDEAAPAAEADIVDTAVAAGQFSTLVAAVQAAELEATLRGEGPFTVFAPTDEAFAALPEGTVEELLLPENRERLQAILTYHVVSGDVRAADVMGMDSATTVQGGSLSISTADGGVQIGEANVVQADVAASNGVIHVIDRVLIPEG